MKIKPVFVLLLASNALFLLLYLTLSFNNRLATDDFLFLAQFNELGAIEAVVTQYNGWNSRWAALFLNNLVLKLIQLTPYGLLIFNLFNLCLYTAVVYLLLKNIAFLLGRKADIRLFLRPGFDWINVSLFVVSILFLSTFKIDETWFWLCTTCMYLWSNMMLLLGVAWLLHLEKNCLLTLVGIVAFAFVGGSAGPLSLLVLLLLAVLFICLLFKPDAFTFYRAGWYRRLPLAMISCFMAFMVLYMAKGNRVRESFFDEISIGTTLLLNVKMTGIILLKRLPMIWPFTAILCIPAIYLGHIFKGEKRENRWKKKVLYYTLAYVLLIYLYQLSITYKTQDVAAYRTLYPISVMTVSYFIIVYFILGKQLGSAVQLLRLTSASLFISMVVFAILSARQSHLSSAYASAYDQRIHKLGKAANCSAILELEPLPPSGMLYSAEISTDTAYFSNLHLKTGLGLKCAVRRKAH